MEPKKHLSEPQFLTAMRKVYGFDIAAVNQASDGTILQILTNLTAAYDEEGKGMVWRAWLACVAILARPERMAKDHLLWAFSLYASEGSFDLDPGDNHKVAFQDMRHLFITLSDEQTRPLLLDAVDGAWKYLAEKDASVAVAINHAHKAGRSLETAQINMSQFKEFLDAPSMAPLFEPCLSFGKKDPDLWTLVIEEHYFHHTPLKFMKNSRRAIRNVRHCNQFLRTKDLRDKRRAAETWGRYIIRRKRARYLMAQVIVKYHVENISEAMNQWWAACLTDIRVTLLQRNIRGFLGRQEVNFLRYLHYMATCVQTRYRGRVCLRKYAQWCARRHWAAAEMQRHVRGNNARRLAMNRLEDFYDKGMAQHNKERWEWENRTLIKATTRIQMNWRSRSARLRTEEARRLAKAEALVKQEMSAMEIEAQRKRKVYEEELEDWYKMRREEFAKTELYEEFSAAEKDKIIKYRRTKADEARRKRLKELREREEFIEDQRVQNWLDSYAQLQVTRADDRRKYLERIIDQPETPQERKERKVVMKEIDKETKAVLKAADKQAVSIEYADGHRIAHENIMKVHMQKERELVYSEMQQAAADYEEDKRIKKIKADEQREATRDRDEVFAAKLLQGVYRRWAGRKVLRGICKSTFRKEFDPDAFQYYYVDQRDDHILWQKPYSLGSYEMKCRDEYVKLRDAEKVPYFYNPLNHKMQWPRPDGTMLCTICEDRFCERYCNDQKKLFCIPCWTKEYEHVKNLRERLQLNWKEVHGGMLDAEDSMEMIEEFPDHSEAEKGIPTEEEGGEGMAAYIDPEVMAHILAKQEEARRKLAMAVYGSDSVEDRKKKEQYVGRIKLHAKLTENRSNHPEKVGELTLSPSW